VQHNSTETHHFNNNNYYPFSVNYTSFKNSGPAVATPQSAWIWCSHICQVLRSLAQCVTHENWPALSKHSTVCLSVRQATARHWQCLLRLPPFQKYEVSGPKNAWQYWWNFVNSVLLVSDSGVYRRITWTRVARRGMWRMRTRSSAVTGFTSRRHDDAGDK